MDLAPNGKEKVECKLVGEDGNAFSIMGRAMSAMRKAKWPQNEIDEYLTKAKSGNYDNLLGVTMQYTQDNSDDEEDDTYNDDSDEEDD